MTWTLISVGKGTTGSITWPGVEVRLSCIVSVNYQACRDLSSNSLVIWNLTSTWESRSKTPLEVMWCGCPWAKVSCSPRNSEGRVQARTLLTDIWSIILHGEWMDSLLHECNHVPSAWAAVTVPFYSGGWGRPEVERSGEVQKLKPSCVCSPPPHWDILAVHIHWIPRIKIRIVPPEFSFFFSWSFAAVEVVSEMKPRWWMRTHHSSRSFRCASHLGPVIPHLLNLTVTVTRLLQALRLPTSNSFKHFNST